MLVIKKCVTYKGCAMFVCRNISFCHFFLVDTPKSASYLEPICSKCSCWYQHEIRHAAANYTPGNVRKPDIVSTFLTQPVSLKWSVSWSFNGIYCSCLLEWIYHELVMILLTDIWSEAEGSLFCFIVIVANAIRYSWLSRKLLLLY